MLTTNNEALLSPPADRGSVSRQLLIDSKSYATEIRWRSWWHLGSTLAVLAALIATVAWFPSIPLRAACSVVIALTLVRMFILYHDFLHQSIFKDSWVATFILHVYGNLMLTPPGVWKRSHDHHHRHNSKIFGASIGSFPIMTTTTYLSSTSSQQLEYRIARSPWVIVFGYVTVFLFGMCVHPLLCDFRKNLSALGAIGLHFGLSGLLIMLGGWSFAAFAFLIPTWIAMLSGAYLFYIQHNFPEAKIADQQDWAYVDAALSASSYLETGMVMRWFTGNIGYHHVHHLNAKIPFYRLPEAMKGLVGLQNPGRTSLSIRDISGCLRLKLWDSDLRQFVTFAAATAAK